MSKRQDYILYEVQEQAQLIYGTRYQNHYCLELTRRDMRKYPGVLEMLPNLIGVVARGVHVFMSNPLNCTLRYIN